MRRHITAFALGLAVMAGSIGSGMAGNEDIVKLVTGEERGGEIARVDDSRQFDPQAGRADYLRGVLKSESGSFDLDLVNKDGKHLRRIVENASGETDFHLVPTEDGALLKLTARTDDAHYRLSLNWQVKPDQQKRSDIEFLSPRMKALAGDIAAGISTDAFWATVRNEGTPLLERQADGSYIVTFLWRGAEKNVRLFGAPSGNHENLDRIGTSDVWYKSFTVPAQTRISYQLAPDVPDVPGTARERRVAILSTAQEDPFNSKSWPSNGPDRYNRDSILELPDAPAEPYLADHGNPNGSLQKFMLASQKLGNTREITIYRPADLNVADRNVNLIFLFDAKQMLNEIPMPVILDNMIASGAIGPTVAVFIANPGAAARARELPANPKFADFMASELLPRVLAETGLKHDPKRTALGGASYGGLASTTVALRHPELFGNVLSMSGSYWWSPQGTPPDRQEYVAGLVASKPVPDVRFFLSAGLFEADASKGVGSILDTNRHLRDVLLARNAHVFYREYAGGHDWLIWRSIIVDGLIALFGQPKGN